MPLPDELVVLLQAAERVAPLAPSVAILAGLALAAGGAAWSVATWHGRRARDAERDAADARACADRLASQLWMAADWTWETDGDHRLVLVGEHDSRSSGGRPWLRAAYGRRRWEAGTIPFPSVDWAAHRADLAARRPFTDFVYPCIGEDRMLHFASISGQPRFDEAGVFTGYAGVGRVITQARLHRLLLELGGDLDDALRAGAGPATVVTALIASVCRRLGWIGGLHLVRAPAATGVRVDAVWGDESLHATFDGVPDAMPFDGGGWLDTATWSKARESWLLEGEIPMRFARRWIPPELEARMVFIVPVQGRHRGVASVLVFFGAQAWRTGPSFAITLSRLLSRALSLLLQRHSAEQLLLHASQHDALTGLPNRAVLTQELQRRLAAGEPLGLLYVDLDRFKPINDTLGHAAGDQVLIEVAARMRSALRSVDVATRTGGDEFVLVLGGLDDPATVDAIARRVIEAIEHPMVIGRRTWQLSASVGVAIAPRDGHDAQALMRLADEAMYADKAAHRARDARGPTGRVTALPARSAEARAPGPMSIGGHRDGSGAPPVVADQA